MKNRQRLIQVIALLLWSIQLGLLAYWWWQTAQFQFGELATSLIALGRLAGLLAVSFALQQFILIGRLPLIEQTFGQDRLSRIHHLTGYLTFIFVVIHPMLIVNGNALLGKMSLPEQYLLMLRTYPGVIWAFLAEICFFIIVGASIWIVRRKLRYEWWYSIHLLTYAAIILPFLHQIRLGETINFSAASKAYWYAMYILVLGLFIYSRILRPFVSYARHQFYVQKVVPAGGNAVHIYISGKHMNTFRYQPGQFNTYTFLTKGMWLQEHPFTISQRFNGEQLRITARNVGDYTKAMRQLKSGTKVLVQGPYGVFGRSIIPKQKLLFIAGGVGITPLLVLAQQALEQKQDVVLLYANRSRESVVNHKEFTELSSDGAKLIEIMSDDPKFKGEQGVLDIETIKRLVRDVKSREVYLCGPPPMMKAVAQHLLLLGLSKAQIKQERFSFHR